MTRVLYIAGYGRSGSTVLDAILGNHDDVFGAGEIELLLGDIAADGTCTCGERYVDCLLWGKVTRDLFDGDIRAEADRLFDKLDGFEAWRHTSSPPVDEADDAGRMYGDFWQRLFASVALHEDVSVVVDSSKTAQNNARRVIELAARTDADLRVIHLIRDPRAVLYSSWMRGNNVALESKQTPRPSSRGMVRPLAGWLSANIAVTISRRSVPGLRVLPVRYDDLVTNPAATLATIGDFADLDLTDIAERVANGELVTPGHGVRGNRMRRSGPIRLRPDSEWITKSPPQARVAGFLFAPFAQAYGCSTWRWPHPPVGTAHADSAGEAIS